MTTPYKQILTIEEILERYYYKEWIIDELGEIGEKTNGTKNELITRYFNSNINQSKGVNNLAQNLLSSLRNKDLKQILKDHNLESAGNKTDLLKKVFASFSFEPYIRKVKSYCNTCGKETDQEFHFGDDWKAIYKRCSICNNDYSIIHNKFASVDTPGISSSVQPSDLISAHWDEVPDTIKYLKTNYWQIIATFIGALALFGLKYGLMIGIVSSVILASTVTLIGFILTESRKMEYLIK